MKKLLLLLVTFTLAVSSRAAVGGIVPDGPSIEAMIYHHKVMSAALSQRLSEELVNDSFHGESEKQTCLFRLTSDELDKLYRNFDIVNAIINGAYTGVHTYTTYNNIKDYLVRYKKLLSDYNSKLLLKGFFWDSDVEKVVGNTCKIIDDLSSGTSDVWEGYMKLAALLTANEVIDQVTNTKIECTTANVIAILDQINGDLDDMRTKIYEHYCELYMYLAVRLGYYNKKIYQARDLNDILNDALGRWGNVAIGNILHPNANLGYGALMGHERDNIDEDEDEDDDYDE